MALRTLEIDPDGGAIAVTMAGRLTCRCPVNGRRDYAEIEVTYRPTGVVIELESFAAYLATWAAITIAHEVATRVIRDEIAETLGTPDVVVVTRWDAVEGISCVVRAPA